MRSTGEVMGIAADFGTAFAKSQLGAFGFLPVRGTVFVSVANRDKRHMIFPLKRLADLGFEVLATTGTAQVLRRNGVPVTTIKKLLERGGDPAEMESNIVRRILDGSIDLVVNTPHGVTSGGSPRVDGWAIRTAAVTADIPCITTVQGLGAAVQGIEALQSGGLAVRSLQDWAQEVRR
jgi:carbamoyl-phosphate synthase large subunit